MDAGDIDDIVGGTGPVQGPGVRVYGDVKGLGHCHRLIYHSAGLRKISNLGA